MNEKEELKYKLDENKTRLKVGSVVNILHLSILGLATAANYLNHSLPESLPGLFSLGVLGLSLTIYQLFSDIKERKKLKNLIDK